MYDHKTTQMKLTLSQFLKNIKKEKLTSGSGIAMLIILVLRASGIDLGKISGMDIQIIAEIIGAVFNAVLLLFARDPKKDIAIQK